MRSIERMKTQQKLRPFRRWDSRQRRSAARHVGHCWPQPLDQRQWLLARWRFKHKGRRGGEPLHRLSMAFHCAPGYQAITNFRTAAVRAGALCGCLRTIAAM